MHAPTLLLASAACLVVACGGRESLPLLRRTDGGRGGSGSGGARSAGGAVNGDSSGGLDAGNAKAARDAVAAESGTPVDAARDVSWPPDRDGALGLDASSDAPDAHGDAGSQSVDCSCPPDDYFVDVTAGTGLATRLRASWPLSLYCDETAPSLMHPPCGSLYRLSACLAEPGGVPCVYIAVDLSAGPVIGSYVDESGQTWELAAGEIRPEGEAGRVATGTFSASFRSRTGQTTLSVSGDYRACEVLLPSCGQ